MRVRGCVAAYTRCASSVTIRSVQKPFFQYLRQFMVHFACGDATSANPLETLDVVADVATGARARRFRGGSEARARRSRYVSRVSAGTRGRARVRGLLRTCLATSTASSDAFDALNTFGAIPRGARRAMDSVGGGRREATPKTARERPQSPRRRARDGDAGARALAAI